MTIAIPISYEFKTPLILDDIEVGNRLYYTKDYKHTMGTLTGKGAKMLVIAMDAGNQRSIFSRQSLSLKDNLARYWSKVFPVEQASVGSRVSLWQDNAAGNAYGGERFFGIITELIPEVKITVHFDPVTGFQGWDRSYEAQPAAERTLEYVMREFDLED